MLNWADVQKRTDAVDSMINRAHSGLWGSKPSTDCSTGASIHLCIANVMKGRNYPTSICSQTALVPCDCLLFLYPFFLIWNPWFFPKISLEYVFWGLKAPQRCFPNKRFSDHKQILVNCLFSSFFFKKKCRQNA